MTEFVCICKVKISISAPPLSPPPTRIELSVAPIAEYAVKVGNDIYSVWVSKAAATPIAGKPAKLFNIGEKFALPLAIDVDVKSLLIHAAVHDAVVKLIIDENGNFVGIEYPAF